MDAVRPSPAVTAAGVDHVRLSYAYLDEGDVDAYGSLFDEHAHVSRPDTPSSGRRPFLDLHAALAPHTRHDLYKIVADGDTVAVMGRLIRPDSRPIDFADFFTLSPSALLLGYRRFYYTPPTPP